jgi:hypothetical protein
MSTTNVARRPRRRGEKMMKRYDDEDDDDEESNDPVLFKWQWYENTHVRVSSSAKDEHLPRAENDRVCERRDDDEVENASEDDDECETEEDSLESEKEENEGDVLNKTLSYRASYWDDALEELMLSSHAQEMTNGDGDDTAATGQSFGNGGKVRQSRRRRARTLESSPWPRTSVAPYVAVVGESIFLRLFDCNNKKEAHFYRKKKVIASARMYGQFGDMVVRREDFILERSMCKFPKDCFDEYFCSTESVSSAQKISNLFFQLEYEDLDGVKSFSAPQPCLLCIEKESAEQFQAFLMEPPTMFGKKFKNRIDRLCSRCGFVKDVGTVFTLWHTGRLYGDLGGHPLSEVVTQCSSDPNFRHMCTDILIELQEIQIDVMCWSMEVKNMPGSSGEEKGEQNPEDMERFWSLTNMTLEDLTFLSHSQLCGKLLLMPFVVPIKFMVGVVFLVNGGINAIVLRQLSERNERKAIRAAGPSSKAFKKDSELFELYRGYVNALVLDKCRSRSLSCYLILNALFGLKYASMFPSEIVSPGGIWGRIAVPLSFVSVTLGVHMVQMVYKRDISIFGYLSGRKQDLFDRYKRGGIVSIATLVVVVGAHGSIARYQRASVAKFCSLRPLQSADVDADEYNGLLQYDCNEMFSILFRQECLHLVYISVAAAVHASYPRSSSWFPVLGCIFCFLAYSPPQFSTSADLPDEVNMRTLFNLYGFVAILFLIISIMTSLNVQAHFKRQSLDWFLQSYLHQKMRSRRGKEA